MILNSCSLLNFLSASSICRWIEHLKQIIARITNKKKIIIILIRIIMPRFSNHVYLPLSLATTPFLERDLWSQIVQDKQFLWGALTQHKYLLPPA